MSFISKIFGQKNKGAVLAIHKNYIEAAQADIINKNCRIQGFNKAEIVSCDEHFRQDEAMEIMRTLFTEASPNPIATDRLIISIPSKCVFPFLKIFPSHSNDEYIKSSLMQFIQDEAPFNPDELIVDFEQISAGQNKIFGATAYPKEWHNKIINVIDDLGIKNADFIPEPLLLYPLTGLDKESCAIFYFDSDILNISFFYKGILFDSFEVISKTQEDIKSEFEREKENFKSVLGEDIDKIYSFDLPSGLNADMQKALGKYYSYTISENPFDELADKDSSIVLSGLIKRLF